MTLDIGNRIREDFEADDGFSCDSEPDTEVVAIYRDGSLRELTITNHNKRTTETYIRNSSETKGEPYATFFFTGIYPGKEEIDKKVNPISVENSFKKDLLTGKDPFEVAKKYHDKIAIEVQRWYRVGINFENNGPIYIDFETGKTEGVSRDKETEEKKRGTRRLLRVGSERGTAISE